jgi:hypothetical protein
MHDDSPGGNIAPLRPIRHLTQADVARRWRVSERTLEKWRSEAKGPRYMRLMGRVAYRLEDIEEFETNSLRSTMAFSPTGAGGQRS